MHYLTVRLFKVFTNIGFIWLAILVTIGQSTVRAESSIEDTKVSAAFFNLKWRELGPNRAGRTTAVAGVAAKPFTYYFGATGGGVWRTDNAGGDWRQLGIGVFGTGSVGAIAVSASAPQTLYVGLGEGPYRLYSSSHGDGIYRSDDDGETWTHLGLSASRQISAIAVHPEDPNTVWVAVQGSPWGASAERGVYKSADGGRTWRRTLFVNPTSGAVDVAFDPANLNILYATLWDHDYDPWYLGSGGEGSGVFKSTDGGETWRRIETGLPTGNMGKVGVVPAYGAPGRVWLLVESDRDHAGLYRSDDGGESWRLVNGDGEIRTRPWYYTHIFADPHDPDALYSFGQDAHKSTDAGATFERWVVAGYDYHALWMNPDDPNVWIVGSDAGASVTVDGGRSWSTTHNQPTAQLYRLSVDNQFPYRVYVAQQDNTSLSLSSRPNWGGYDTASPSDVGGGETGYIAPDPFDSDVVYGTSELGWLTRYNRRTNAITPIHAHLSFSEGVEPRALPYRFSVNSPVLPSIHKKCVLYHGAQVLLRSRNCGDAWEVASPDLTFNDESRQGAGGGPYTNEVINHFGAIASIAESPMNRKVIWTGSNDGAVAVTRDGGKTWSLAQKGALPEGSANTVEASPHRDGTAFVAVYSVPFNDYRAHAFRTDDFGATWQRISTSLPADTPVRVIREDPKTPNLLVVGTEEGVYYSKNGGRSWASLRLNMPAVPVTDIKFAGNDLVISTQGRGVWVLYDISPLRQLDVVEIDQFELLTPAPAYRVELGANARGRHLGSNAEVGAFNNDNFGEILPTGAAIDFVLPEPVLSQLKDLTLEVVNHSGEVVRRFILFGKDAEVDLRLGHNRIIWDFSTDPLPSIPRVWDSRDIVAPAPIGHYTVQVRLNGLLYESPLEVKPDPRLSTRRRDLAIKDKIVAATVSLLQEVITIGRKVEERRACLLRKPDAQEKAITEIDKWQYAVADTRLTINNDRVNYGASLIFDLRVFLVFAGMGAPPLTATYHRRLDELSAAWAEHKAHADSILNTSSCVTRH